MLVDAIATISNIPSLLYGAFTVPGRFALFYIIEYLPETARWLNVAYGDEPMLLTFMLSLAGWFIAIVPLMALRALAAGFVRWAQSLLLTYWRRSADFTSGLKTIIKLKLRRWLPNRKGGDVETETVELSRVDLTVLTSAHALGADASLNIKALSELHNLRSSRVERSLQKLCEHRLVANDDTADYRVTPSGIAYAEMLTRQRA